MILHTMIPRDGQSVVRVHTVMGHGYEIGSIVVILGDEPIIGDILDTWEALGMSPETIYDRLNIIWGRCESLPADEIEHQAELARARLRHEGLAMLQQHPRKS